MSEVQKRLLSIDNSAIAAGCGRWSIYKAISDGKIEAKKLGRRTLVVAESLYAYIDGLPRAEIRLADPVRKSDGMPKRERVRLEYDLPAK